jgi:hypothetical protein
MSVSKRIVGEIWKDMWDSKVCWRCQWPHGLVMSYRTKKLATEDSVLALEMEILKNEKED